jgi:hypothetical protein
MIALVVAATSHTRVLRLPGVVWCGTRVHPIPQRLGHIDRGDPLHDLLVLVDLDLSAVWNHHSSWSRRMGCGCPGARLGTETLIGVLEATVRDPPNRAPAPNCLTASTTKQASGVGGQPARFSRLHGVPAGIQELSCNQQSPTCRRLRRTR